VLSTEGDWLRILAGFLRLRSSNTRAGGTPGGSSALGPDQGPQPSRATGPTAIPTGYAPAPHPHAPRGPHPVDGWPTGGGYQRPR
jgi:hypothetical protein